ncbi:NuoI/complex I 23 kDa subunit family protein [Microbacter margulisiae]|uniref:NADH-quinone oxidoreductase subunit I n=1 Tax=Microbacter margulisiae TaxID=1350067 RepID=A0A7W5DP21_9PORP|nr:NADH-quinone oxidoreductase subunit I [Microbacter margulisiae]MBB3186301.1 NADH-quinone oxidoreductase subunit I [Microbacter margulisiae]
MNQDLNKIKLTDRSQVVSNKKMTLLEKFYLPAIFKGLYVTFTHLFRKKTTIQFPEVKRPVSSIYRGMHVLKRDEEGRERCTACGLCALSCPAEAITMVAKERLESEKHLYREEKYAAVYEINMLRCIYCGDCETACPKEAIFLTDRFVPSEEARDNFIYGKDKLLEPIDARIDVSKRQTPEVLAFKKDKTQLHNK